MTSLLNLAKAKYNGAAQLSVSSIPQKILLFLTAVLMFVFITVYGRTVMDISRTDHDIIVTSEVQIHNNNTRPSRGSNASTPSPVQRLRVCTQKERLQHMQKICSKRREARADKWMKPKARATVDMKHKLMMCWMSKAGCTSFKALLLDASDYRVANVKITNNLMNVHKKTLLYEHGLEQFGNLTKHEADDVIHGGYYRFMLIRHPLERLLSTYRGKVLDPGSDFGWFSAEALKFSRPYIFKKNSTLREMKLPQKILGPPTFNEFLTWIWKSDTYNDHWSLILEACHPCALNWSAVMRLETMEHDSKAIVRHLKPDLPYDKIPVRHSHQSEPVHDHDWLRIPEFESVKEDVVDHFLDMYSIDMEMFGYHWDKTTKTSSCEIHTDDGSCC